MLKVKKGAKLSGLRPEMVFASFVCAEVYKEHGYDCWFTEGTGGKHGIGSLHFVGLAADYRTRDIPEQYWEPISSGIREALGEEYDVILHVPPEVPHLHVEFQPKR